MDVEGFGSDEWVMFGGEDGVGSCFDVEGLVDREEEDGGKEPEDSFSKFSSNLSSSFSNFTTSSTAPLLPPSIGNKDPSFCPSKRLDDSSASLASIKATLCCRI